MGDYNNDDLEEEDLQEEPVEGAPGSNRNFLLALAILGGVFLLLVIVLLIVFLNRPKTNVPGQPNIAATNLVIEQANAATAVAATQTAGFVLTPSVTPTLTITPLPSATSVVAIASATPTVGKGAEGAGTVVATETGGAIGKNTATVAAALTLAAPTSVVQTQAAQGKATNTPAAIAGKGTATALPTTGFADEVGLPGLFGMAIGLVVLIVIVRRLRLSPSR